MSRLEQVCARTLTYSAGLCLEVGGGRAVVASAWTAVVALAVETKALNAEIEVELGTSLLFIFRVEAAVRTSMCPGSEAHAFAVV